MGLGYDMVGMCTYHMPATNLRVISRTNFSFLSTIMCVAANVSIQPSSNIFPMEIIDPDWMWGKICAVLYIVDKKGIRLSSALWVACTRLPFGRITCNTCYVLNLFTYDVSTLIYFCVAPVSAITYIGLYVDGFPLQFLHSLVFCIKDYIMLVLSLSIKLCLMLFNVSEPSCHAPSGITLLLPLITFRDVALLLFPSDFLKQTSL